MADVTRDANRIVISGEIRTIVDREEIRTAAEHAVAYNIARSTTEGGGAGGEIILDVAHAQYLDSYALITLVGIARKCLDVGMTLAVEGASAELQEQLRATHLDTILGSHGVRMAGPAT